MAAGKHLTPETQLNAPPFPALARYATERAPDQLVTSWLLLTAVDGSGADLIPKVSYLVPRRGFEVDHPSCKATACLNVTLRVVTSADTASAAYLTDLPHGYCIGRRLRLRPL